MRKRKGYRKFTDLSFTRQDLAKNSQKVVAKIGYHILLRVKPKTAINAVWKLKMLAKGQGVKSVKKVIGFKTKTMLKGLKRVGKRAKTGITKRTRTKTHRKPNGRIIQKSKRSKKYQGKPILVSSRGQPYIITRSGRPKFIKRIHA